MNTSHPKSAIRNLVWWACASLISIAILQNDAVPGLLAAVVGGIVLGILLFK